MSKKLAKFELPKRIVKDEQAATETYTKFIAEPFVGGFGHTIGNSLRRVLLSSIEGAAICSIKIDGVDHEFQSIPGIVEDVVEIVLNLKKVLIKSENREPFRLTVDVDKQGAITAGDITPIAGVEIINPEQVICTLDKQRRFFAEFEVKTGRGFSTSEENKYADQPIGEISIDSIFSPVKLVKYEVQNTRVGQMTDYDKLVLEIWTDGRITPENALIECSAILAHHLDVFTGMGNDNIEFESEGKEVSEEQNRLRKLLNMSVNEIELSVRAANCLNNANITSVGELALKSEQEMLKYRNFGKKSLNEIKAKLEELGLSLGMKIDERLIEVTIK